MDVVPGAGVVSVDWLELAQAASITKDVSAM